MPPEKNKFILMLNEIPIISNISSMSAGSILTFSTLALGLYLGGVSSYILGVILSLPWPAASLINTYTIVHLTGQLTFMMLIAVTLFKISKILSAGIIFQWNFMICKFYLGPKRYRGIRNPAIVRINKRLNNSAVEGRSYAILQMTLRSIFVVIMMIFIFFRTDGSHENAGINNASIYSFIGMAGLMGIFGSLSAYRVSEKVSHRTFLSSPEGRRLIILSSLFLCLLFGILRGNIMLHGPALHYTGKNNFCRLISIMPVNGGDLFFDHDSSSFLVISSGTAYLYIPTSPSQKKPSCI